MRIRQLTVMILLTATLTLSVQGCGDSESEVDADRLSEIEDELSQIDAREKELQAEQRQLMASIPGQEEKVARSSKELEIFKADGRGTERTLEEVKEIDGRWVEISTGEPYTGIVVGKEKQKELFNPFPPTYRVKFEVVDGLMQGWKVMRDSKGNKISETPYVAGKVHGKKTTWYADGKISSIDRYSDGQRDGKLEYWSESGFKEKEYSYKAGELDGPQRDWYENGQVKQRDDYEKGSLVRRRQYDENGNMTYKYRAPAKKNKTTPSRRNPVVFRGKGKVPSRPHGVGKWPPEGSEWKGTYFCDYVWGKYHPNGTTALRCYDHRGRNWVANNDCLYSKYRDKDGWCYTRGDLP